MGSRFTAFRPGMETVLRQFKGRGLMFLDSRTTAQSVGDQLAQEMGVPTIVRHVFLDDDESLDAVRRKLAEAEAVARRQGFVVAIGHPHEATLQALGEWLPGVAGQGHGAGAGHGRVAQEQWVGLSSSVSRILSLGGERQEATRSRRRGGNDVRYAKKAMIVAPQPEPTEAGADVLREGGNAVDAGIACALVQGVVDPLMCGIAGFGSCGIYMPGKKFHGYIDAHAPAPLGARPDMWANLIESEARDGYGFILKGRVNDIGYKSICAPANLKMYYEAHKEHGSLPWSRIVEPAIAWAESGWTVRPHVHYWWSDDGAFGRAPNHERTGFTPAARALYCRADGTPKRVGDRVVNRDYGQTLRAIAKGGADVFYSGEIAQAIAEDMKKNEALLSIEDLKAWKPVRNAPLWGDYRGYKVSTNQPPGGGVMLLEMLNILENFELGGDGAQFDGVCAHRQRGDEARHHRQGRPCRRSEVRRRCRSIG